MQQPGYPPPQQVQHTTVVVQPGQQVVHGQRGWSSDLCACFDDFAVCCCVWCVPCIIACQMASAMNESCCVPNCLQGGLLAMRVKMRMQYNIGGTICNDWCQVNFCGACAMCQMARELKTMGAM